MVAWRRIRLGVVLLGVALAGAVATASAQAAQQVINSSGPLTAIYLNDDLACQVQAAGDASPSFFGGTGVGACGTFLAVGGANPTLFGPHPPAGVTPNADFTPVSQTSTGSGTQGDPFTVVTVVDAKNSSGSVVATLTETDTYVAGQNLYTTQIKVTTPIGGTLSGTLYHAGDCFLASQDSGYGALAATNAPQCTINPSNSPPARFMAFAPVGTSDFAASAAHYIESGYSSVWAGVTSAGNQFPNTVDATTQQDNGMGLSWGPISLGVSQSATVQFTTAVTPNSPPVSSSSVSGGCLPSGTIPVAVSAVNGPAQVNYIVNGGAEQNLPTDASGNATISLSSPGYYAVEFWGQDKSGHQEANHHVVTVTVASTGPTLTITSDQGKSSYNLDEPASVTIAARGPGLSSDPSAGHVPISTANGGSFTVARSAANACGTTRASFVYTVKPAVPAVSVAQTTVSAPASGTMDARFHVTLSGPSASPISIGYTTVDGTAVAGRDYTPTQGTLTLAAGETTATITVPVLASISPRPALAFSLRLTTATNAVISSAAGTAAATILPAPVLGSTVNLGIVSGQVYVKLPSAPVLMAIRASFTPGAGPSFPSAAAKGPQARAAVGQGFIPLTQARQLPVGTLVDATRGVASLTSATAAGGGQLQSGDFGAGVFMILQNRRQQGLTRLNLIDAQSARQACGAAGRAQVARRLSSKVLGLLNASVHGRFSSRGQFSAATVRGTEWTVVDRCDGTLTQVTRGVVIVRDFRLRRTIAVSAGHSYLARATGGRVTKPVKRRGAAPESLTG